MIVLDTESRALGAARAGDRVARAVRFLADRKIPLVYKKIDSTLRGNLGAEIEAVLDSAGTDAVLLAPTLPRAGRTVRDGVHRIGGVALAETEMARDPLCPISDSEVARLLAAQSSRTTAPVPLARVRGGRAELVAYLTGAVSRGARILVADAETEEDLESLAGAAAILGQRLLPCGSAGLFAHVAAAGFARLGDGTASTGPRTSRLPGRSRPGAVLVVSGSMSEVTREQIRRAEARWGLTVIRPDASRLYGGGDESVRETERVAEATERGVGAAGAVVLDGASLSRAELQEACAGSAEERERRSRVTLETLVAACIPIAARVRALVLVGGDTAMAICGAAGASGIDLDGEIEPLVPRGTIVGGELHGMPVVTKAGGLGSVEAVALAVAALAAS